MFNSEKEMSVFFEEYLSERNNKYVVEFKAGFGVPDFLIFFPYKEKVITISVELKLSKWKDAIRQAFRHRNYSNISYVVVDEKYIHRAVNNINFFKQYNIGLASFNREKCLKIHLAPSTDQPFCSKSYSKVDSITRDITFHREPTLKLI